MRSAQALLDESGEALDHALEDVQLRGRRARKEAKKIVKRARREAHTVTSQAGAEIREIADQAAERAAEAAQSVRVSSGGKRLRPLLVLILVTAAGIAVAVVARRS